MFPGANAERAVADYAIVGAPLDATTTFEPGTRFGPERIRRFAIPFDDYDHRTGLRFSELSIHDAGDLDAWNDPKEYLDFLDGTVAEATRAGAVPLLLGGEHTVSVAGVRATAPECYVTLDAHLDLHEEYANSSLNHACITRRALETTEEAVVIGARTGSESEYERAEHEDVTVLSPEELDDWQPDIDGSVYLSVDIDAADPGFAPGTGTKEPFGLTPREMRSVVRALAPSAVGFDVVEVNDRDDGQAAALAGKLLREFVFSHAAARAD